jgi:hypothetical protein
MVRLRVGGCRAEEAVEGPKVAHDCRTTPHARINTYPGGVSPSIGDSFFARIGSPCPGHCVHGASIGGGGGGRRAWWVRRGIRCARVEGLCSETHWRA